MSTKSNRKEEFEELISTHQHRIYGYIYALLRDAADAQDVFQQTTIILWKKFDQFDLGTSFFSWAATVARFEALNFAKYRRRSRVYFDQDLMEQLAVDADAMKEEILESRRVALRCCLDKLSKSDRKMIDNRYLHGLGSRQIADILGRSSTSVCNSLSRIRQTLLSCIDRNITRESLP